tara:strand:+ start:699 stop:2582 length:1884 start_codon:yes stop_codon:yes gene_type:complete
MYRFMRLQGFENYHELYDWSINQRSLFWEAIVDFCDIQFSKKPEINLIEGVDMVSDVWFPDAKLNFAEHLLKYKGSRAAIIFRGEENQRKEISFDQLRLQVASVAYHLKAIGLRKNDCVAAFLPNCPEAIIAMLACSSIGIIWSSCSPDFGVEGVVDRFGQIKPKLFFAVDGYLYNGKKIDTTSTVTNIVDQIPSIKDTIIIPFLDELPKYENRNNTIYWSDLIKEKVPLEFASLSFNHPLYILFSSGTTGLPKCIVHGAGGTLIQQMKEHILHYDIGIKDRLFYFTTCGWMMWNWMVTGLATGSTLVIYDGSPFYNNGEILWDLVKSEKISVFGVSAKYISAQEKAEIIPKNIADLSSIRTILSTGSPLAPESFDYVYRDIKSNIQLSSVSGGTDIISCFVSGNPILPVRRGELQCLALGMAVEIYDEKGGSIIEENGELVCTKSFPSMPIYFWNDTKNKKYHAAYFERYNKIWCQGDFAMITKSRGMVIHGRSDTVLNPGGVRIGTADIYSQVEKFDQVIESIVIGQNWDYDVRIILFLVLRDDEVLTKDLKDTICDVIRENTTPKHVPSKIIQVKEIPRTRSGKIVELAVKKAVQGEVVDNTSAIANPECLEYFKNLTELEKQK